MDANEVLMPSRQVRARYNVSDMGLWRWLRNPGLNFPQPIYINKRRYWPLSALRAWEIERATKPEAA
jgi:hypothetical protein